MLLEAAFSIGLISAQAQTPATMSPVYTTPTTPAAPLVECPEVKTADNLDKFRTEVIQKVTSGDYTTASSSLNACFKEEKPNCLKDVSEYIERRRGRNYDSYDPIPAEGLTIKSEKDLPKEFQVTGPNGQTLEGQVKIPPNVLKLAKEKGWKAVSYKTRSTGGFDFGPNLTIIAIPGADKDVYLQISPKAQSDYHNRVNDPYPEAGLDMSKGQETLTIITVDKTKNPPVGQLRKLGPAGTDGAYSWNNRTHVEGCTECHASPLRSISPRGYHTTNGDEKRMKPEDEKTVSEINEMMTVPGLSWGKLKTSDGREVPRGVDGSQHPLGWAPPNSSTRKPEFLQQCATRNRSFSYRSITGDYKYETRMSDTPKIDYEKVATWMSCSQCHSNTVRGALHPGFSNQEIAFKLLVDRSMPPGADLNNDERMAILNCLYEERSQVRREWSQAGEWLKKEECADMSAGSRRRRPPRDTSPDTQNVNGTR